MLKKTKKQQSVSTTGSLNYIDRAMTTTGSIQTTTIGQATTTITTGLLTKSIAYVDESNFDDGNFIRDGGGGGSTVVTVRSRFAPTATIATSKHYNNSTIA